MLPANLCSTRTEGGRSAEGALSDWAGEAPPPPTAARVPPCSVVRWTGFVPTEGTPMAGADAGSCHSPYKHGIPRSVPAARCGH